MTHRLSAQTIALVKATVPALEAHGATITATMYRRLFENADIYLCGPRPFLRCFVAGLARAGVPVDRIHYEFFGPADEALAA